jgi:hypothetical protein
MAIKHLTYLDIPPDKRQAAAKKSRERLRGLLGNPTLTPSQVSSISDQMVRLDKWERGELPTTDIPPS